MKVVVGMSGGVDSSVAAYLLQQAGHEVIGLFMKNWHDDQVTISNECPWLEDSNDALLVANQLGIPFQTIDLSTEYKERIVNYMFLEYQAGRTPNPDILCNREIKFDLFLKIAIQLGADMVATGHYCRKTETKSANGKIYHLLQGLDRNKDQSYFLCQLNQFQLSKALFPIGGLQKSEVREIAKKIGLTNASKKDSQGLCFIGKVRLPEFLQQQLKPKNGDVLLIRPDDELYSQSNEQIEFDGLQKSSLIEMAKPYSYIRGEKIGTHKGAHFYTIGQRKGLQIGGFKEPLFVLHTDTLNNIIWVGEGENHPGLYRNVLFIENQKQHWVRADLALDNGMHLLVKARIRYRQSLVDACLYRQEEGLYLAFKQPMKGITPGQFAVWYLDDELIGSGEIRF